MVRIGLLLILFAPWLLPGFCMAVEVEKAVMTTGITDRHPDDAGESFPASVGRLYCYTELTDASAGSTVTHAWYWEGREMARVQLPVRSPHWRTWSSKTLRIEWTGKWEVKIIDENGNLLRVIPFTLR